MPIRIVIEEARKGQYCITAELGGTNVQHIITPDWLGYLRARNWQRVMRVWA